MSGSATHLLSSFTAALCCVSNMRCNWTVPLSSCCDSLSCFAKPSFCMYTAMHAAGAQSSPPTPRTRCQVPRQETAAGGFRDAAGRIRAYLCRAFDE
jgi:hypothetical protein